MVMSSFGQQQDKPGYGGIVAVGGDFSFLIFIVLAIVFIVRAARFRGKENEPG
jgi:hypothetical protein